MRLKFAPAVLRRLSSACSIAAVVAPFQIVGETQGKAIDRIELGIDALRQLQSLDRGIRLP